MPQFTGGLNIALKIPKRHYEKTVAFYRDVLQLKLEPRKTSAPTVTQTYKCQFGQTTLWLDEVANYAKSDVWMELKTDNMGEALEQLNSHGIEPSDELEEIPENVHWVTDPAGIVYVLTEEKRD